MAEILYGVKLVVLEELDPNTQDLKAGGVTCRVETADSVEVEPVYSNGTEKILRTDSKILAVASTDDLLYGYKLKFVDNVFDMSVSGLIEGGVLRKSGQEVIGYDTAMLADGATMKPFRASAYVANYEGSSIKNFTKLTFNNCKGKASKLTFKDDFSSPEFEIDAREATKAGKPIKSVDFVDVLPATDTTVPTLTLVSTSPVTKPANVVAKSNEVGGLYMVAAGAIIDTMSDLVALVNVGMGVYSSIASVDTNVNLATSGLTTGAYKVYAVDAYGNISVGAAMTLN